MKMLLLVFAAVLLVGPAVTSPHHRLNHHLKTVFDLADRYNKSLAEEFFVEDVLDLAEGRNKCQDKFFCKVYNILHAHLNKSKEGMEEEEVLVRNLKMFTNGLNPNCTELLKDVRPSGVTKPIPEVLGYLTQCIQHRNLNRTNSSP